MKPTSKMFRILLLMVCFAIILSACGGGGSVSSSAASTPSSNSDSSSDASSGTASNEDRTVGPTGQAVGGGFSDTIATKDDPETLNMVTSNDPGNLDPQDNPIITGIMLEKHIYDTLMIKDAITGELKPGLATSWEWIDDTHLKCTLREGVKFHNGDDFNAGDVLDTLRRLAVGNATKSLYSAIDAAGSSANGDYEVIIAFSAPFAPAINYLSHQRACIISAEYLAENGDQANYMQPIGTGAYSFVQWNIGSDMTLTRNDDWWGLSEEGYGDCHFKNLHINFAGDLSARAVAVESGDVDIACAVNASDFDKIFAGSTEHLLATKVSGVQVNFIAFNYQNEIFNDERVRLAMAYAVDWESAVPAAGGSLYALPDSAAGPSVFGYVPQGNYEYDPDKARELLKDAGYEDGFEFTSVVFEGTPSKMWEIMQAYWAEIGIMMEFEVNDTATWTDKLYGGTVDMCILNMSAVTMDPAQTFSMTAETTANVMGRVSDERYNELYQAGLIELDTNKRAEIYAELQAYIFEKAWQIPMFIPDIPYVYWDYIGGVIPDGGQQPDMRFMYLITE